MTKQEVIEKYTKSMEDFDLKWKDTILDTVETVYNTGFDEGMRVASSIQAQTTKIFLGSPEIITNPDHDSMIHDRIQEGDIS